MASQELTSTPAVLTKDGTTRIDADIWYTIQNKGNKWFFIQTSISAPSNTNSAFVISPFGMMQVKRASTHNIYVWQNDVRGDGEFGTIVIEPSE